MVPTARCTWGTWCSRDWGAELSSGTWKLRDRWKALGFGRPGLSPSPAARELGDWVRRELSVPRLCHL